jgi:hypothetical protein
MGVPEEGYGLPRGITRKVRVSLGADYRGRDGGVRLAGSVVKFTQAHAHAQHVADRGVEDWYGKCA